MADFLGISGETWAGAILGAIVSAIFTACVFGIRQFTTWWKKSRPRLKVLGALSDNREPCTIFLRDFQLSDGSTIQSSDRLTGTGIVPNVRDLWSDVEGRGLSYVFNSLGQAGKRSNISIVQMSQDPGIWNTNIIVMGAQAQKCFDFYEQLDGVMYAVDADNIFEKESGAIIQRETGYGYGIILKVRNPLKTNGAAGVGILIGGYGTLGTAAAAYYFQMHLEEIGKEFGKRCFGIVVRASITAGEQSAEQVAQLPR